MNPILSATDIHKTYTIGDRSVAVLKGISMEVAAGEFVAIMGPSGSGKSTLLHLMGGLDRPTRGRVQVAGQDLGAMDDRSLAALRNRELGFVFQQFFLLNYYSALDNACLPLFYAGTVAARREVAASFLKSLGLGERLSHRPFELSGGEKQRVAIARALINQPKIVFADEPTGALDSSNGEAVMELLKQINQRGTAIVLITHDARVASYASRIYQIHDGEMVS